MAQQQLDLSKINLDELDDIDLSELEDESETGLWNRLTTPIEPLSRFAHSIADFIDDPTAEDRGFIRPFLAGSLSSLIPQTPLEVGIDVAGGPILKGVGKALPAMPILNRSLFRHAPQVADDIPSQAIIPDEILPPEVLPIRQPLRLPETTGPRFVAGPPRQIRVERGRFGPKSTMTEDVTTRPPEIISEADPLNTPRVPYVPEGWKPVVKTVDETVPVSKIDNSVTELPINITQQADEVRDILRSNPNMSLQEAQSIVKMKSINKIPSGPRGGKIKPEPEPEIPDPNIRLAHSGLEPEIPHVGKLSDLMRENWKAELLNLPRAIQASVDISAPLRQGLPLITRSEWWKAWNPMIRSYGSENAFRAVQKSILEKPLFRPVLVEGKEAGLSYADQVGLKLTDLTSLSKREEALMSTWAERIPLGGGRLVRGSNRAYTAFLNKLRADTFESLLRDANRAGLDPENNLELGKQIAGFVNNATGRGSMGNLERHAVLLNSTLFSPRLIASRVQMMNPANYISPKNSSFVRKQYLKAMLSTAGAWTTFASLGAMSGADVNLDPTNSDFGKIRIGNTRIDPAGGFQQYLVAISRLVSGQTTSSTSGKTRNLGEGFGSPTRLDVAQNFAANKLQPVFKFAYDMLNANEYIPFDVKQRLGELFVPMIVQDVMELLQEDPTLLPLALPASAGMGVQVYE